MSPSTQKLVTDLDHVPGLQQHIIALQQCLGIVGRLVAVPNHYNRLRISRAVIISGHDGPGERQIRCPGDELVSYLTNESDGWAAGLILLQALERLLLSLQISRPGLRLSRGFADAARNNEGKGKNDAGPNAQAPGQNQANC